MRKVIQINTKPFFTKENVDAIIFLAGIQGVLVYQFMQKVGEWV